jgi:hypothetical protein
MVWCGRPCPLVVWHSVFMANLAFPESWGRSDRRLCPLTSLPCRAERISLPFRAGLYHAGLAISVQLVGLHYWNPMLCRRQRPSALLMSCPFSTSVTASAGSFFKPGRILPGRILRSLRPKRRLPQKPLEVLEGPVVRNAQTHCHRTLLSPGPPSPLRMPPPLLPQPPLTPKPSLVAQLH